MKADNTGRRAIKIVNSIVNYIVLVIIVLLIAFAGYALWDAKQLFREADKLNYAAYKPTAMNEGKSFAELQAINPEVIAWLSVYGTNIDYPVTQGQDNMKYINTNAEGLYSLSGAIFLDSSNSKDFGDFNSILYGHHMDRHTMFGDIDRFADRETFDSHKYGNLYFDRKDHGIEFFAFVHSDAYDKMLFMAGVQGEHRHAYLDVLLENAMYTRDIGVTVNDQIVLLTTCSSSSTNGRDILIGRITDRVFDDPFLNSNSTDGKGRDGLVKEIYLLNVILVVLLIVLFLIVLGRHKTGKGADTNDQDNKKQN